LSWQHAALLLTQLLGPAGYGEALKPGGARTESEKQKHIQFSPAQASQVQVTASKQASEASKASRAGKAGKASKVNRATQSKAKHASQENIKTKHSKHSRQAGKFETRKQRVQSKST
jgi:hypothetical protein